MSEAVYPTDKFLKYVKNYDLSKKSIKTLMDDIESEWWMPSWGWKQTRRKDRIIFEVSTGGWSGNEDIIEALQKNELFWCFMFEQSRVGGHYIFSIWEGDYK